MSDAHTTPASPVKVRRHLRNLLLDTGFQIRYTLVIVLTSAVLTAALGWLLYRQMRETSAVVDLQWLDAASQAQARAEMAEEDRRLLVLLGGFGVVLVAVLFAYGILFTHKVAGPLHKMSQYLDDIGRGRLGALGPLRRGDQLQGFHRHLQAMHEAVRERTQQEAERIDAAVAALDRAVPDGAGGEQARRALADLRELRDEKRQSLG